MPATSQPRPLAAGLEGLREHLVPLRIAARRALMVELASWAHDAEKWLQSLADAEVDPPAPTTWRDIPPMERVALNTLFYEFGSWRAALAAYHDARAPVPVREVQPHAHGS